jgi:hypothetical protein
MQRERPLLAPQGLGFERQLTGVNWSFKMPKAETLNGRKMHGTSMPMLFKVTLWNQK